MPNRLIREKSPYLLQHATNPVDWHPWGEEAFTRAESEQKPIFLSIGYSTCHWCHVMEKESFESEETASLLNAGFISIKVDREERPDVDRLYMSALHAMGQNGGWPMSMFLTPDRKPFYGGTYFAPASRHGRPGFPDLLRRISDLWQSDRPGIAGSAESLTRHLIESASMREPGDLPGTETLDAAYDTFARTYDAAAGGFGDAPKFPRASVFSFLLGCFYYRRCDEALAMTATSLRRMAEGGIYDQLGGGFHRYSVDAAWRVPHFEKMLYDQAQLVCSLIDVYRITRDNFFSRIAGEVLDYVKRDLALPGGGFACAEDADSDRPDAPHERGEGAFYIWTRREVTDLLGAEEGSVFCHYFGIEEEGNAPTDPHSEFAGRNVLYVAHPVDVTADACSRSPAEVRASLSRSRSIMLAARATRPRPLRDDKVLTAWNGLMISAFARAATVLDRPGDLDFAVQAAEFVLHSLRSEATGELFRRWREGEARHPAQLDDYAFLCQGLLDLYQATFDVRWLREALALTRLQIGIFRDDAGGGFFDSPGGDSSILVRTRDLYDGAEPSGNAVTALNLLRLANLTGDDAWRVEAERTLAAAGALLRGAPHAAPFMAAALDVARHPAREVVLAGRREDEPTGALMREVTGRFLPDTVLLLAAEGLGEIAPFAASLGPVDGKPAAYVCSGRVCRLPVTDAAALGALLDGEASSP